jgi:hypothetical protein
MLLHSESALRSLARLGLGLAPGTSFCHLEKAEFGLLLTFPKVLFPTYSLAHKEFHLNDLTAVLE